MFFKQYYLGCLAHASYVVGDGGEAAVVDPRRDVDEYIADCEARGLRIRYILETHLHADFVSGHIELAQRTGATICLGHRAGAAFAHRALHDGDEIRLGGVALRVLETPGHTPEGVSYLVLERGAAEKVLTGDTLFIGDVGRPDLVGSKGFTPSQMAAMLYDSLHQKLLALGDAVEVWPAHGAGSSCGRNISSKTSSTIGEQRATNYALQPMTRQQFVTLTASELPPPPQYFSHDAEINRQGARPLDELPPPAALPPAEVRARMERGMVAIDVRAAAAWGNAHVPGSLNLGLTGNFAPWAGALIAVDEPIVLVADDAEEARQAQLRLARVGMERVDGYLDGGIAAWHAAGLPLVAVSQMPVDELRARLLEGASLQIFDVRKPGEYQSGHVPGAINVPLDSIEKQSLDASRATAVVCASGYRSSAATSLLERKGFKELYNVTGGTTAWVAAGFTVDK